MLAKVFEIAELQDEKQIASGSSKDPAFMREELKKRLNATAVSLYPAAAEPVQVVDGYSDLGQIEWHKICQDIQNGDTDAILELINTNPLNVNGRDRGGSTVLLEAVFEGKVEIVKLLIQNGASLHQTDNFPSAECGKTALEHAVQSKNKDIVLLLLQAGALFNLDDLIGCAQKSAAPKILNLLCHMRDYNLNATQANALMNAGAGAWTWILQGFATNIELPFDLLINTTSELLGLGLYDTCQVMLGVLNKFSLLQNACSPVQPTQVSSTSLSLFSIKLPLDKLELIKDFIKEELEEHGITNKGQYMECKPGYIKDRVYGCHLGIGASTGCAYVRDRFFSIELREGKVCCSKAITHNGNSITWQAMTKEEITKEIMNGNSLISHIINHQQAKQEAKNTPEYH
ncbi:hypothetical protein DGG96_19320 [Legionella qingyii]|uniref:Ankyrin repeat domain-containing protein n=1 Tax=Legionella qingyii TaxID=2184757 RepID=A0A317TX37_9GAMM|nr:ankyrin repeat domain-containing protein [Legionella qingyii]PWY53993.1 hypothetical protein DGG96_19320 [Legionella qingyii]RUR18978.1 ankyrin repeat domain-containing protein [Legionella qingyii]RUR21741.1 ankyrin repeat domain-containing protein [Legionella qingyii]